LATFLNRGYTSTHGGGETVYLKSFVNEKEHETIKVDGDWALAPGWFLFLVFKQEIKPANEVERRILEAIIWRVDVRRVNPNATYLFRLQRRDSKFAVQSWEERKDIWAPTLVYCVNGMVDFVELQGDYFYCAGNKFHMFSDPQYDNILWVTEDIKKLESKVEIFRECSQSPRKPVSRQVEVERPLAADELEEAGRMIEEAVERMIQGLKYSVKGLGERRGGRPAREDRQVQAGGEGARP